MEKKLDQFKEYYNQQRMHYTLESLSPNTKSVSIRKVAKIDGDINFKKSCHGLYSVPVIDYISVSPATVFLQSHYC